jgi:uncharacterized protein
MNTPLSPSRPNDYLGCPHQAALWLAGASAPAPDATIDLIRTKGFEHEAKVLARLEAQYGKAVHISGSVPAVEREAATRAAIAAQAPLIYQAALIQGHWIGFPDFLVRKPATGGAFVYEPEDAKLARKAKVEHLLQLGIALLTKPAINPNRVPSGKRAKQRSRTSRGGYVPAIQPILACGSLSPICSGFTSGRRSPVGGPYSSGKIGRKRN